jgi:hypothetical protein
MVETTTQSIRTVVHCTRPGLATVTTATELLNPPHRRS